MFNPTSWTIAALPDFTTRVLDQAAREGEVGVSRGYRFGPRFEATARRRNRLTSDDGPSLINTPMLLDELRRFGVS